MKVKYIFPRNDHMDNLYKTGSWDFGESKEVPDDVAKKLLVHYDSYVASTDNPTEKVVIKPVAETQDNSQIQDTYDLINAMEKPALKTYIKTQFNRNVDMRQYKEVGSLRKYATQLTDQYGTLK